MNRTLRLVFLGALGAALALPLAAQAAAHAPVDTAMLRRADRARIMGNPAATVWVVEVSDFQCPFCRMWHDSSYAAIKKQYVDAGKVRFAYLNFPLSMHKNALPAAQAAMCAAAQDKFWPMQDALFNSQASWERLPNPAPVFDSLAKKNGVDVPQMRACIASGAMNSTIDGDIDRAKEAGVESTPTFLIGGVMIKGAQPLAAFQQAIDGALARAAATTPKP